MQEYFDSSAVCKDIEAVCSKCGESWHVIVAVADGKIAQVECKSCGGKHKYKPIARDRMTQKKSTKTTIATGTREGSPLPKPRSSSSSSSRAKTAEPKILKPKVEQNNREMRAYSIKSSDYRLGDRISHPKFGEGIVDEFPSPNKMYVTFETERALLVYGK